MNIRMKGIMVDEQYNQLMNEMIDIMIRKVEKEKSKKNDNVAKVEIADVDKDETEPNPKNLIFDGFNDEEKINPDYEGDEASKRVK